jgi:hypothetical protein
MPLPKFSTAADLRGSKWKSYLDDVYSVVPAAAFPLDLAEFNVFYAPLLKQYKIGVPALVDCPKAPGQFYTNMSGSHDPGGTVWQSQPQPYAAAPANTWVEGTHCADPEAVHAEQTGVWFYVAKGSGIFVNTGNTKVYPDHSDAVQDILGVPCDDTECGPQFSALIKAALAKGYDSLQFLKHDDQRCGNSAVELLVLHGSGAQSCGGGVGLRKGWAGVAVCACDPAKPCTNCGLDPLCGSSVEPATRFDWKRATIALAVSTGVLIIAVCFLAGFLGKCGARRPPAGPRHRRGHQPAWFQ